MNKRKAIQILALTFLMVIPVQYGGSWGFWAHQRINRIAVFTLPPEMMPLFKTEIEYITANAVNPDKRRYAVEGEAPRHYIDIDHYGEYPFRNVPRTWDSAVAKFSEDTLMAYGIVPWNVVWVFHQLTDAFKEKDRRKILRIAADLGHYIADAHVPLHTTINYNGQLTNQVGIHGFWESRIPELFGDDYNYFIGKARYIEDPLKTIWRVVLDSHLRVDSVLRIERELTRQMRADRKYSYEKRGDLTVRTYSQEFSARYNAMLNDMAERRMRKAIITVGSFWFTAWVNAGQPDLSNLKEKPPTEEELQEQQLIEQKFREGKIKGRFHPNTGLEAIPE